MSRARRPTGWEEADDRVREQLRMAAVPGRRFYAHCWCGAHMEVEGGPDGPKQIEDQVTHHVRTEHRELWEELRRMYVMGVHRAFADIFLETILPKGEQ